MHTQNLCFIEFNGEKLAHMISYLLLTVSFIADVIHDRKYLIPFKTIKDKLNLF